MMQLEESLYRAEGLVKQNAEKELPLEKKKLEKESEYKQLSSKESVNC